MKSIVRTAGLCLVAMFTLGMMLAGNASALVLLWLVCLPWVSSPTRYDSNQCTKASGTGSWESVSLSTKSDTVRLLAFSLLLVDKGTGLSVHCPDAGIGWGLLEKRIELKIKVLEIRNPAAECKLEGSFLTCNETAKLEKIDAVALPWRTVQFEPTEGRKLGNIEGNEGKPPGWEITCDGFVDECVETKESPEYTELLNEVTGGILLVLARFENRGRANCTIGGTKQGEVKGSYAILLWSGNGLSISNL